MLRQLSALLSLLSIAAPLVAGFGISVSGSALTVDTSAGLVFVVQSNSGDITSMKFNGIETQDSSKNSHIASGIGASCSYTSSSSLVIITCKTSTLTQYYVAKSGQAAIHMATYTTAEPDVGELRFIARLKRSAIPNGIGPADINGGTAIEGSDVYLVNGQTRSKFYSSVQFISDQIHTVSGNGVAVSMIIPGYGYESSSGGPFFRDIDNQGGSVQELYFYMNSGHTQTESNRMGLHGPYALWFTSGSTPSSSYDLSFWDTVNPSGYVKQSGRGFISGKAIGVPSAYASQTVIGWSNSAAQYWARAESSTGNFYSPAMKPGTYTMTLYKGELAVGSQSVAVSVGSTMTSNIHDTNALDTTNFIWKIGEFDGTPNGFLNADKIQKMHPSDSRMSSWGPVTFTVGNSISSFPMAIFKAIGALTIKTNLSSSQIGARTLVIGTTLAFAGGRPQVQVNGWTGPGPSPPTQPDSRGVTRGTYRGNNVLYTINIPSGTLVAGTNTIVINVISGSSGDKFLSPNIVLDAVGLY